MGAVRGAGTCEPVVAGVRQARRRVRPSMRTPPRNLASTQRELLKSYLEQGHKVSNVLALHLGIGSLSSRIAELRSENYPVVSEWREDHMGRRFKVYFTPKRRAKIVSRVRGLSRPAR